MSFGRLSIKIISAFLSLLLFVTNTLLAHALETNFWRERQECVQLAGLLPAPEIGNSTFQAPNPKQISIPNFPNSKFGASKIGNYLELGAWNLGFLKTLPAN